MGSTRPTIVGLSHLRSFGPVLPARGPALVIQNDLSHEFFARSPSMVHNFTTLTGGKDCTSY